MEGVELVVVTLGIGDVHASRDGAVVETLLGSCIAVCLHDAHGRAGGMNHFVLPGSNAAASPVPTRFGVPAMDRLVAAMEALGALRERLVAKVFGGGRVLDLAPGDHNIAERNIAFARRYLAAVGIPIVAEDVAGSHARRVRFHTDSGRAFVRHVKTDWVERSDRSVVLPAARRVQAAVPHRGD